MSFDYNYSQVMAQRRPYELVYDPEVGKQILKIERKSHAMIRRQIEAQLRYEPDTETRNRKPLLRPSVLGSAWELRFGPDNRFRVFYRADHSLRQVHILAIGMKRGNRLLIGGEEFNL